MTEIDASKVWYNEEWVRQLFIDEPALVSMAMRAREESSRFGFNYCACVMFEGKIKRRWFQLQQFTTSRGRETFKKLLTERADSRWLDDTPPPSEVKHVVNRHILGLDEAEVLLESREQILEQHGEMMLTIFHRFTNLSHIGKRRDTAVSPRTFMFILKNTELVRGVTWMADPSVHRMLARVRTRQRWARYGGPDSKDALDCSHIFTRADVFTHFGVTDRLYTDVATTGRTSSSEPHVVSEPAEQAPAEAPNCTKCGISLASNKQFGTGDEKLCGECELNGDEANALAQARKVYLPPAKKLSRYDPRPGIDDQGLGFYSPAWED